MRDALNGAVIEAGSLHDLRGAGIRHGFFTKQGGVSDGIYASLNCGFGSNDDPANVLANRARVARHLGSAQPHVVTLYQTHSATALAVDKPYPRDALPQADAVVTRTPGLVIGALAADCNPVLFADPQAKVVAGYQNQEMPTFQGQISEDGLLQLIAYIKTLTKPDAVATAAAVPAQAPAAAATKGGKK